MLQWFRSYIQTFASIIRPHIYIYIFYQQLFVHIFSKNPIEYIKVAFRKDVYVICINVRDGASLLIVRLSWYK